MTDLFTPTTPPNPAATPRKCRRHEWVRVEARYTDGTVYVGGYCERCFARRDDTRARRGKSARRLGSDQERRIERVYGPTKIGERGDPVDHIGAVWRWQSKATRALPPKWLAAIDKPTPRMRLPLSISRAWGAMAPLYEPRASVLIRSYVHAGTRTRDWLFVDSRDANEWLGLPVSASLMTWWVIPGDWWLDH